METRRVGIVLAVLVAAVVLTATPASAWWIWEGCTPGFWKNHTELWVGVTPSTPLTAVTFSAVGLGYYDLSGDTFMDALNYRGGRTADGAARNLMRAAAAAYLNAAHPLVNYPRTTFWIVSMVNFALLSQNRDTMLSLAALLDQWNNLGATF